MAENRENSDQEQPRGRFRKGQSGNPAGKPKGTRHRATRLAEMLIDGQAEAIVNATVQAALEGDTTAQRVLMDRLVPPRKERPIEFQLPPLETAADAPKAMAAITAAVASGDLTASEAADLAGLVERFVRAVEASDFEARLRALEERAQHAG